VAVSRPSAPSSTYRVQLTPQFGFEALAAAAPYLDRLGVGAAYLSPILQAAPGSEHGYDVVDHAVVSADLGGEDGLRAAAKALHEHGIAVVVDVVPNHMALPEPEYLNHALWAALRDGPASSYASWFDIELGHDQPVIMPILGHRIDEVLDAGELTVDATGGPGGEPVLRYYDHVLPIRPGTEHLPVEDLLAAQHYRVAYWRVASEQLNYRRFFDIDTLVAIRVEEREVFDATHAVLSRLVAEGFVDGVRVDHPDGLADPRGYLRRLAQATDGAWVVVEKILAYDESLPTDWPCAGTTGYESLQRVGGLFVDPAGGGVLRSAFGGFTGDERSWYEVAEESRRHVLDEVLVAEVDRLAAVAHEICQDHLRLRDYSRRGLADALDELLIAMHVYRAYVVPGEEPPPESVALLEQAATQARERSPDRAAEVDLLRDLALGRLGRGRHRDEFVVRFQQTSGPVAAKGVEDTACYRWFPLSALGEVGGEPDRFGVTPEEFHAWAAERQETWPYVMNSLSTHDTKRSEDVRARLAALSEIPGEWAHTVHAWRSEGEQLVRSDAREPAEAVGPGFDDAHIEWLFWQTLVGAWPIDADRLVAYLVKAAREAKVSTTWSAPDEGYERGLSTFVRCVLADESLMGAVAQLVERLQPAFVTNSLGQRAIQLLTPGVPDIYGGCETVSLRLVDPDNREPVRVAHLDVALEAALAEVPDPWGDLDAAKLRLTALGLDLRRRHPHALGASGAVLPVRAKGEAAEHVVGLVRGYAVAAVASRFALRLAAGGGWRDTVVLLPPGHWRDVLTGAAHDLTAGAVAAEELFAGWPVALLVRAEEG